jgi:hypothetical protein
MAMLSGVGVIERAFQLARTGRYRNPTDIQSALRSEGFVVLTGLFSPSLRRQLLAVIRDATGPSK